MEIGKGEGATDIQQHSGGFLATPRAPLKHEKNAEGVGKGFIDLLSACFDQDSFTSLERYFCRLIVFSINSSFLVSTRLPQRPSVFVHVRGVFLRENALSLLSM